MPPQLLCLCFLVIIVFASCLQTAAAQSFTIASVPQAIVAGPPRSTYQIGICFSYDGLSNVNHTIQLWLLDSYHRWCAATQFCPYEHSIDNRNGQATTGTSCIAVSPNITFISPFYQWVANIIIDESKTQVGYDSSFSAGVFNATPPSLEPIGNKQVSTGSTLTFKVNVTSASTQRVYSLAGAPEGASISDDGTFTWTPTQPTKAVVMVTVADAANSYLSDSEIITIVVNGSIINPVTVTRAAITISGVSAGKIGTPNPKAAIASLTLTSGASTVAATTTGAATTSAVTASTSFTAATTGATIASTLASSTTAAATSSTSGTTTGSGGQVEFPPVVDRKFSDIQIVGGLQLPTDYAFLPDGSMLIAEKAGRVLIFKNDYLRPDPWIDIRGEVSSFGDRGLMSIVVDPEYNTNNYVYLAYTVNPASAGLPGTASQVTFNRIIRFTSVNDKADPNSRFIVLGKDAADGYMTVCGSSHSFGALRFAPDKSLMFSSGDGANFEYTDAGQQTECDIVTAPGLNEGAFKAQNLNTLNGKIARIDRFTGLGLPDNPFYDAANPIQSRVWAIGLRNPFRFDIKPDLADNTILVLGCDVGWATYEEVNVIQAGANLGWPCWEGMGAQPEYGAERPTTCINPLRGQLTRPIIAWNHQNASMSSLPGVLGNAAAGVATYAGTNYPAGWQGGFWFGDYQTGWIKVGFIDLSWQLRAVVDFSQANSPITFGRHPFLNGDIIYISFYPGQIRRIQYGSSNPIVVVKAIPPAGPPGTLVNFVSDGTHDPLNRAVTYSWDFGDGDTSPLPNPTHIYASAGIFHAKLTVTSAEGSATKAVTVNTNSFTPVVYMSTPSPGECIYAVPQSIQFYADTSDSAGPVSVVWDVQLVHNGHFHPFTLPVVPENPASFELSEAPDAQGAERYSYRVVAHAVNAQQVESVAMVSCVAVGSANQPPVAKIVINPTTAASPYAIIFCDSLTSVDPDGDILWVEWDFGDGIHSQEQQTYHTYGTPGSYTITLTVSDNYGGTSTATQVVTIT